MIVAALPLPDSAQLKNLPEFDPEVVEKLNPKLIERLNLVPDGERLADIMDSVDEANQEVPRP